MDMTAFAPIVFVAPILAIIYAVVLIVLPFYIVGMYGLLKKIEAHLKQIANKDSTDQPYIPEEVKHPYSK